LTGDGAASGISRTLVTRVELPFARFGRGVLDRLEAGAGDRIERRRLTFTMK